MLLGMWSSGQLLQWYGMSLPNYVNCLIASKILVSEGRRLPSCAKPGLLLQVPFEIVYVDIHSVFASFWEVTIVLAAHHQLCP